jgi:hypothetical protein
MTMLTRISKPARPRIRGNLGIALAISLLVLPVTGTVSIAAEDGETVNQPPVKIVIDPPDAGRLARGVALIHYRTENLQILPVFGADAAVVVPRIGHLHVHLDDSSFGWAHTSGQPLIVAGLTPGPHHIVIEAASANHEPLAQGVVKFEVPRPLVAQREPKAGERGSDSKSTDTVAIAYEKHEAPAGLAASKQPRAKIVVDPPLPGPLARGVVLIQYRTENLQIAPVFGPAALAISPRVGHLHVTVDDATWHWADASGGPVIVSGLPAGKHRIVIELADANHQTLALEVVQFEVPGR